MNVEDVMTREVVTVGPDATLKDAAALLAEHRISGLPVVDDGGSVVGVFSERDVLAKELVQGERAAGLLAVLRRRPDDAERRLEARRVGDAMSSPPITIGPGRPLGEAASTMVERDVNRLPVVDGGRLVGLVSRADLVRAFTRSDEEIAQEVREEVLVRTLLVSPKTVEVEVEQGAVTLRGWIEDERAARAAEALVARIPGVLSVDSHLGWRTRDPEG